MAKQKANHWIPDNLKGEASKRLGPVKEAVGRRGRCLFVINENGQACGEPANNNCHVIPNASVLGNLKDEKTGKVLDLRWGANSWEHLFLSSSKSKPINPANMDRLDPQCVGTGDACVRWFACKPHDDEFGPIDTGNPDFGDPVVRFLSVYRAALSAADFSHNGRSILERWDRPILNSPNIPLRVQWSKDRNVLRTGIPRAESFAARLGKIWYRWKTHGELDPDFVSVQLLSFRSRLKLAACVSYGNGLEVVAFPVAEDLHRMGLLYLSEDADSVSEDKETLGQLSNACEHGDSYGVCVAEELMTNGRGMVAASPESYDDLPEEDRQTIRRLVARNSRVDRLVDSIPLQRRPPFSRGRR